MLQLGAKEFLTKPIIMEERVGMVRALHSRWLKEEKKVIVGPRNFNPWSIRLEGEERSARKKQL